MKGEVKSFFLQEKRIRKPSSNLNPPPIAYSHLRPRRYDAWLVFDADSVADPDFLAEMNNACLAGAMAAQSYRDSKNPCDTALSGCASIYIWMMDRFHNRGKAGLGLSATIGGTGFMMTQKLLDKLGGWYTKTISEDLEITAQAILAGERVAYVPKAITYDEQPLVWEEIRHTRSMPPQLSDR